MTERCLLGLDATSGQVGLYEACTMFSLLAVPAAVSERHRAARADGGGVAPLVGLLLALASSSPVPVEDK